MPEMKKLERLLTQGKITRREFLARASALGFTAAMFPALLTTPARAATPKKGGRLRIGVSGSSATETLDPATMTNCMTQLVNWETRNSLVEIDCDNNAIPELAESWECTPDAKKWIFKVRRGVEFHNGKTLDAQDVVFSINHHRGEDSKSAAKPFVGQIEEIKAEDKYTVVCTLKGGNADFAYLLSAFHMLIVPNGTDNFDEGMGTGGYILQEWEPGVRSFAKRNPNYWKEGRAHFDEVETLAIADVNARINALTTGRIDVTSRIDPKTVHMLEETPGVQVVETHGKSHQTIPMLTDIPPFDNNDVRLALKHAIDREHMVKMIFRGRGSVGNDHPISGAYRYFASELPQRVYDPDKARYYMKKAGLKDHTFRLHAAQTPFVGAVDMALLYKEHAAKAGIKIEVIREPDDGYWSEVWMKKPWNFCFWFGRATEDWMFSEVYAEDAPWNETHWKHERFNKLLKEARAELDKAKRREMYVEMQSILRDEGGNVIPTFSSTLDAATTKLRYEKVAANFELDGLRVPERWWFGS